MTDLSNAKALVSQLDAAISILSSLGEDDWAAATRCPPWDVRQLAAHLAIPAESLANGVVALRRGAELSEGGNPLPDDLPPAEVLRVLRQRRDRVRALLDTLRPDDLDQVLPPPAGSALRLPARTLLDVALVEVGVHVSDIKAAVGAEDALDVDLVRAISDVVPLWLIFGAADAPLPPGSLCYRLLGPTLDLTFSYAPGDGWATPGDAANCCVIEGTDSELALSLMGRARPTQPNNCSVAIGDFKRYLPGP